MKDLTTEVDDLKIQIDVNENNLTECERGLFALESKYNSLKKSLDNTQRKLECASKVIEFLICRVRLPLEDYK